MTEQEKWNFIIELEEKHLQGGVILSEWTTFLAKDAEIAYCSGANLSSILTCQSAIESHLRFDYFDTEESKKWGFYKLIENSSLTETLKNQLHELRLFRNKWVHVNEPENDHYLLERPEYHERNLEEVAKKSIELMIIILFDEPWI